MDKTLKNNKFIIILGSFLFIFIFLYFKKMEDKEALEAKINKVNIFDNNITDIENKIKEVRNRISGNQVLGKKFFEYGHEAEELYNLLSRLAMNNKLLIENISKGKIKRFLKKDVFPGKKNPENNKEIENEIIFSMVMVDYRITGNYESYMKFR